MDLLGNILGFGLGLAVIGWYALQILAASWTGNYHQYIINGNPYTVWKVY